MCKLLEELGHGVDEFLYLEGGLERVVQEDRHLAPHRNGTPTKAGCTPDHAPQVSTASPFSSASLKSAKSKLSTSITSTPPSAKKVDTKAVHGVVTVTKHAQAHALQVGNRNARLAREPACAEHVDIKRHVDDTEFFGRRRPNAESKNSTAPHPPRDPDCA